MSLITLAALASLGRPAIIEEVSHAAIKAEMLADYEARCLAAGIPFDTGSLKTEPMVILLETAAFREVALRARINDAARANLLAFGAGTDLDHVGGNASPSVERMPGEDDERFRLRILLTTLARNVGADHRYRLIALEADSRVRDAIPYRLGRDPRVNVAVLSTEPGGVASEELLGILAAAFADPEGHLTNGDVILRSAVTRIVDIEADITLLPGTPATLLAQLSAGLQAAWQAEGGLGRDLTADWTKARLAPSGVYSVALRGFSDQIVPPYEAVSIGSVVLRVVGTNQ